MKQFGTLKKCETSSWKIALISGNETVICCRAFCCLRLLIIHVGFILDEYVSFLKVDILYAFENKAE